MILVFGTICLDRVRRVPHMPESGGYVEILSEQFLLGGEAANTANALRTWGVDCVLAGNALGRGEPGEQLRDAARSLPLFEGHVVDPGRTPVCDVYVADDGERTMIGQGFSDMEHTIDPCLLPFQAGEWFTAEPNMGQAAREAVRLAHAARMKTYIMDFVRDDEPVFPGSFWQTSTDWAGTRGNVQANLEWLGKWTQRHDCFAILSDGPNGFVAGSRDRSPRHYPPYPAGQVLDATGSGDMFRAGMLFGLEHGWPHADCLRFASAAGCLACRSLGATAEVPPRAEIEDLILTNPDVSSRYDA